ncbi:MAG TPA: GNAT family N-acetyltransferase [Natronosporangium sp.]
MLATRIATPADIPAIARVWAAANRARHAEAGLPSHAYAADAEQRVRNRLAANPGNFAVLVEDGDQVVAIGFVVQALADDGASQEPLPGLAHVAMVGVHPDRWGQGLGGLVVEQAQRTAKERGYTRAQLWTQTTNRRAQRLYERLGWQESGKTKVDNHGELILHYQREL